MTIDTDLTKLPLFDLIKRGSYVGVRTEDSGYFAEAVIEDVDRDGEGGLVLTLSGTLSEGELVVTKAMLAGAEQTDDYGDGGGRWETRGGGLFVVLERVIPGERVEALTTPEQWEAHRLAVEEREAKRDARAAEREGRA